MEAKLNHYSIDAKRKGPQLKPHLNATAERGASRVPRTEDTEKRYLFSLVPCVLPDNAQKANSRRPQRTAFLSQTKGQKSKCGSWALRRVPTERLPL